MRQEIFMPNGHKIFDSSDERVHYDDKTLSEMVKSGYTVKIDGRKKRSKKE